MPELPLKDQLIPLLLEVLSGIIAIGVDFEVSELLLDLGELEPLPHQIRQGHILVKVVVESFLELCESLLLGIIPV